MKKLLVIILLCMLGFETFSQLSTIASFNNVAVGSV